ncbi:MAG TPA: hypothetical protein ENH90_01775, partial [bacterium]|nr:hypothetical protein [bacterium]
MVLTRFQAAIRGGAVDVTNFRDESRFRGTSISRVVAKPKPGAFATRDELNRALARAKRTGTFPAAQFIGLFRLSNVGAFVPKLGPRVRQPIRGAELESLKKVAETEKRSIVRQIERRGGTIGALKQRREELGRARAFFARTGGPFATTISNVQTVSNTSAALRQASARSIGDFEKNILLSHAKETDLGKVNADFVSGRITRNRFVFLVNNSIARAKNLEKERIANIRRSLFTGTIPQKLDRNIKQAISIFKNIPKPLSSEEQFIKSVEREQKNLENLKIAVDKDSKSLQKRIDAGLATSKEVTAFNLASGLIFNRQKRSQKKVDDFNKKQEAELKAIPRARREDFVGELNFQDVKNEFAEIPKDAIAAGKFLQNVFKTRKFDRRETVNIKGKVFRKADLFRDIGEIIGGTLSAFGAAGTLTSFSVQERFKNVVPSGQIVIPPELVNLIRGAKRVIPDPVKGISEFFITNPLKFVKVENGKYIITPRAAGETGRAAFDVILIFSGRVKAGRILKINKAGKPIGVLGGFKLTGGRVRTSFFNKLKVKNFKELALKGTRIKPPTNKFLRSLGKIPEFKAVGRRVAFEVTEGSKAVGRLALKTQSIIKKTNAKIAEALESLDIIIQKKKLGVQLTLTEVRRGTESTRLYLRELNNLRKTKINQRLADILKTESKRISVLLERIRLPTFIKKGSFTQFQELKNLKRSILDSAERIATATKTKFKIPVKKVSKFVSQKVIQPIKNRGKRIFNNQIANRLRNLRGDYKAVLRELRKEKKLFLDELAFIDRKKLQPALDRALFPIDGRIELLERYFKTRKNFKKLNKEFSKKAFRDAFLKDLKALE